MRKGFDFLKDFFAFLYGHDTKKANATMLEAMIPFKPQSVQVTITVDNKGKKTLFINGEKCNKRNISFTISTDDPNVRNLAYTQSISKLSELLYPPNKKGYSIHKSCEILDDCKTN